MLHRKTLLSFILATTYCATSLAQESRPGTLSGLKNKGKQPVKIVEPDKKIKEVQSAAIDTEKFELGLFAGMISVEDFKASPITGLSFTYHAHERWIAQINYGSTSVSKAEFESLQGRDFITDRNFTYIDILGGYKLMHGRSFLGGKYKFNSDIYVVGGIGDVKFADQNSTSYTFGLSYRIVITDAITANLDFHNHLSERTLEGVDDKSKLTQNTEMKIGLNLLF